MWMRLLIKPCSTHTLHPTGPTARYNLVAVPHNSSLPTVVVLAGYDLSERILSRMLICGPGEQPSRTDLICNITPLTEEMIPLST